MTQPRLRFAPSPSGDLHVGNARTALFNWLYARKEGGRLVFRVEDSDADRSSQASVEAIERSLRWLGLDWDEGHGLGGPHEPYRQSERGTLYRRYADELVAAGRAYYCYDTEEELEAERQRWIHSHEKVKARHPHRSLSVVDKAKFEAAGRQPSIRFATDDLKGLISWRDLVRDEVIVDLAEIRDFNLLKSDGTPMYNFACVVDDHLMGITHVLRGEDGVSNTPRQLLLYQAFGWGAPNFGHVSFILGPDGQKLSKRHGDTGVSAFKAKGYLPEALLNYLGLLGLGGEGEGSEIFSLEDLKERFSPSKLIKKSSVFDYGKLDFLNAHYLREKSSAQLRVLAAPFLEGVKPPSEAWLEQALELFKGNAVRLSDFREPLLTLLRPDHVACAEALEKSRVLPSAPAALAALQSAFGPGTFPGDAEAAAAKLKEAQKASGLKGKDFYMPARLALTDSEHGPEMPKLLLLLGRDKIVARAEAMLRALKAS